MLRVLGLLVDKLKEEVRLEKILVVNEYLEVFLKDLAELPPDREVKFAIDLAPSTTPLLTASYRMEHSELV